jgi:heptosyltransferase III
MTNKISRILDRCIGIALVALLGLFSKLFSKRAAAAKTEFKRILVIKLAMMGDTILLLPAIRALRERFPASGITMICTSINKSIVEDWNCIDGYMIFDFKKTLKNPLSLLAFLKRLRSQKYDLVIDFEEWIRVTALFSYFSGAPRRIGFKTKNQFRHYIVTDAVPHRRECHEVDCFNELAESAGAKVADNSLVLPIKDGSRKIIQNILAGEGIDPGEKFVLIHPGCGDNGRLREWGEERFGKLIDYLQEKYSRKVVLTGSREEVSTAKKVFEHAKHNFVNLAGKTGLKELFALIDMAELVICGNTGIMHAAAALGRPLIAIHGPTDPRRWGPTNKNSLVVRRELDCSPCLYLGFEYGCSEKKCLNEISERMVFDAVDKFLGGL